jgi:hypothetical protein
LSRVPSLNSPNSVWNPPVSSIRRKASASKTAGSAERM